MNSDSPTTNRHNRLTAFIHKTLCATCRRSKTEWTRLSRGIERLEDEQFPPSLDETLLSDAMRASAAARTTSTRRPRALEALTMRRLAYAAAFVVIILIAGAFLFPRIQGNAAIADAMRAMASVKTCHFTGWTFDKDGNRAEIEGWFKSPGRMRVHNGGSHESLLRDGKEIIFEADRVTISKNDLDAQSMFVGGLLRRAASSFFVKVDVKKTVLPDGREALIITGRERQRYYTGKIVFTVDQATDLMVSMREYDKQNQLTMEIDGFEYDVPIADSVFEMNVPDGVTVVDLITPPTPDQLEWRLKEKQRLIQAKAEVAISLSKGSDEIRGYRFECIRAGGLLVFYIPGRNVYRVLGSALVEGPDGFAQTVEDGDIRLPHPLPDPGIPSPPPPLATK